MKANFNFEGKKGVIDYEPTPTLTKREQFAMAAMQANQTAHSCSDDAGIAHNAQIAVRCADALIKELEK